jgi:hypothetical protein
MGLFLILFAVAVGYLAWFRVSEGQVVIAVDRTTSPPDAPFSSSESPSVPSLDPCQEAVKVVVAQLEKDVDFEALTWSLDACLTLNDWDQAFAESSVGNSAERIKAVSWCQLDPKLQPTLLCLEAIRKGLVEPLPLGGVADQGQFEARKDSVAFGRVLGSSPGNRINISWFNVDEADQRSEGIPFTYRISGPLPGLVAGLADTGFSGSIRIPGWTPGMTIRVEITSVEDPSLVSSFPYTYVEESRTPG